MELRKACPADYNQLIKLSYLFETSPFTFDKQFKELSDNFTPAFAEVMLKDKNAITLLVEDNDTIVGFITINLNRLISKNSGINIGNVLLLVVDKKFRGGGLGRMLVEKSVSLLITMGAELITVGTDIYNIPAINVYEACGFKTRMSWHIFRYYREYGINNDKMSDNIDILPNKYIELFKNFITRPISLLKEKSVDKKKLKLFLDDQFYKNIKSGKSLALGFKDGNDFTGMINVSSDKMANETLKFKDSIYKISDLISIGKNKSNIRKLLLEDIITRMRDFKMIEIWVDTEESEIIHDLEDVGFKLSYTGVSLHYKK